MPAFDMSVKWPNGARVAVMLTFDFDAETLWMARDPENARRPGILSQGKYGAKVGVPKILETLEDAGVPATFFIPGWTVENHTGRCEMILKAGHEIGHHSYSHEWIALDDTAKEVEEMERGLHALKSQLGVVPKGYRSPAGETSENLIRLLDKHGFVYNSSLLDDINPYRHAMPDGRPGPIELPWHWSLDDAPYALFSIKGPRPIFPNSHLKEIFQAEFQEIHRWGGTYNLVMHPQVSGRPSRIALLREMIAWMREFPGVWFADCAAGRRGLGRASRSPLRGCATMTRPALARPAGRHRDAAAGTAPPWRSRATSRCASCVNVGLQNLDPIASPSFVTRNFAYMVYDTLVSMDSKGEYKPQMLEVLDAQRGPDGLDLQAAPRPRIPRRHAGHRGGRGRLASSAGASATPSAAGCWRRRRRSASSMPQQLRHRPRPALRPCDRGAGQAERARPLRHARPHRQRHAADPGGEGGDRQRPLPVPEGRMGPRREDLFPPQPGLSPARGSRRRPGRRQAPAGRARRIRHHARRLAARRGADAGRGGLPGIRAVRLPAALQARTATW